MIFGVILKPCSYWFGLSDIFRPFDINMDSSTWTHLHGTWIIWPSQDSDIRPSQDPDMAQPDVWLCILKNIGFFK